MRRHLTLLDILVLVAATAVGLGMARAYDLNYQAPSPFRFLDWARGGPSCIAASLAIATVMLRLCHPRHRMRRLLRQPGFVACTAVAFGGAVGAMLNGAHIPVLLVRMKFPDTWRWGWFLFNDCWHGAVEIIPFMMTGAWITLAVSGHWRAEQSWIDRLGRAVGIYWLAYIGMDVFAPVLAPLFRFFL